LAIAFATMSWLSGCTPASSGNSELNNQAAVRQAPRLGVTLGQNGGFWYIKTFESGSLAQSLGMQVIHFFVKVGSYSPRAPQSLADVVASAAAEAQGDTLSFVMSPG